MAVKFKSDKVKRVDGYMTDPFDIEVKDELRGRVKPPTAEKIIELALSLQMHGQQMPVVCRKLSGGKLQLVSGFTRVAAARLLRSGFEHPDTKEEVKDENFLIRFSLTDGNDKEAFIKNVVENAHRHATSVIDDAHNQRRMRENYGYTDSEITRLFNYGDPNKVGRLRRLLALPDRAQDMIHEGYLSFQAALDILDLDEADQAAALEKVYQEYEEKGKVNGTTVRELVRSILHDDDSSEGNGEASGEASGENPPAPPKKKPTKPRTIREIRTFFDNIQKDHPQEEVQKFAEVMLLWIAGKRADRTLKEALEAVLDAERG